MEIGIRAELVSAGMLMLVPVPAFPARGPPTDWGEPVQVHFRPGNLSGVG